MRGGACGRRARYRLLVAAYVIVNLDVHDAALYEQYRTQAPAFVAKHGGRYLVRGGASEVVEGEWQPRRLVVLEFPDMDSARSFFADPEYAVVAALRHRSTTSQVVMVEGVAPSP